MWDRQDVKERNRKGQMVLNFPKRMETVVKKEGLMPCSLKSL